MLKIAEGSVYLRCSNIAESTGLLSLSHVEFFRKMLPCRKKNIFIIIWSLPVSNDNNDNDTIQLHRDSLWLLLRCSKQTG